MKRKQILIFTVAIAILICSIKMVPNQRFLRRLTYWQAQSLQAFDSRSVDFMIFEWARRHWKTTTLMNILIRECVRNPKSIYTHVFPFYTEARQAIWDDPEMLDMYLPDQAEIGWKKNESKMHVRFDNGSLYRLVGADKYKALRGQNFHGIALDEWSMIIERAYTEVFFPILSGKQHAPLKGKRNRFALFGYTPKGVNHATRMFDWAACINEQGQKLPTFGRAKKCKPRWFASRVINDASNFLDASYLKMAEETWPRAIRDQEINCARVTEEERVLITSAMLEELKGFELHPTKTRHIVSCDPSLGGDACPILHIVNGRVPAGQEHTLILHERNPMIITGEIIAMMTRHKCEDAIVDATGITIGQAIVARMAEQGHLCYPFGASEKAIDERRFVNKKTEAWMTVCEQIQAHEIPYPEDQEIREDLSSVRYKTSDSRGRLALEPKEDTKKRLGRSPDKGDAFVMGNYRLPKVEPVQDRRKRKHRDDYDDEEDQGSVWSN